jgi:hypothetical protein
VENEMESRSRIDEKQIGAILRRAVELQQADSEAPAALSPRAGITLDELERIAAEVGIDPRHVRAAAGELESGQSEEGPVRVFGGPKGVERERVVEGVVSDAAWEAMVAEVRRTFGHPGEPGRLGRSYEWTWKHDTGSVQVVASPAGEQTRLQVATRFPDAVWLAWFLSMLIPIVPAIILGVAVDKTTSLPGWASLLPAPALWMGSLLYTRQAMAAWLRKERQKIEGLLSRLGDQLAPVDELVAGKAQSEAQEETAQRSPLEVEEGAELRTRSV